MADKINRDSSKEVCDKAEEVHIQGCILMTAYSMLLP